MDHHSRMCPIVNGFRARVPVAIQATEDWTIRISQFSTKWQHHWPRSWSWRFKLEARAQGMVTTFDLPEYLRADVAFARTAEERSWAMKFWANCRDTAWSGSLAKFDSRVLQGLFGPGALTERVGEPLKQSFRWRRDARRWRHEQDIIVPGFYTECEVVTRSGIQAAMYPRCPEGFFELEVPYGMYVETPSVCHIWGLMLAEFPYRERETAYRRGSLLHALWCAFHTQWVRNVAFELLRSATHRGHRGRLWRLSPTLLGAMETVGLD
eukprot:IDg23377t1